MEPEVWYGRNLRRRDIDLTDGVTIMELVIIYDVDMEPYVMYWWTLRCERNLIGKYIT